MPSEPKGRARTTAWMLAALNSIGPGIQNPAEIDVFHAEAEWARPRRPAVVDAAKARQQVLAARLKGRGYLESRFTAADLIDLAAPCAPDVGVCDAHGELV